MSEISTNDPTYRPVLDDPVQEPASSNHNSETPTDPILAPTATREIVAWTASDFDAATGTLEVDYANGQQNRFRVPLDETGAYLTGKSLEAYVQYMRPYDETVGSNPDALSALVTPRPVVIEDYLKARRWETEIGGLTLNGMTIATDDRSKLMVTGARLRAERALTNGDSTYFEEWDAGAGTVRLSASEVIAISDVIAAHVSACFKTYGELKKRLDSGEILTPQDVDAAFATP